MKEAKKQRLVDACLIDMDKVMRVDFEDIFRGIEPTFTDETWRRHMERDALGEYVVQEIAAAWMVYTRGFSKGTAFGR